jgi:F-type H+-transporting ATPase subunit alpha
LSPVPIEFQLGWMVAFNDGMLDTLEPSEVAPTLQRLGQQCRQSGLTLDDEREHWSSALRDWLTPTQDDHG